MFQKLNIWIVDDERIIRVSLADDLKDAGYNVREFANAGSVIGELKSEVPDIIITDLKMPAITGIELMEKIKKTNSDIYFILMTAFATIENAVDAMKLGAFDYVTKPFNIDRILLIIDKIKEIKSIKSENKILKEKVEKKYHFSNYIGDKSTTDKIFELVKLVANTDTSVLITGETGTGKELLTNIIHYNSDRANKPFVKVSCAVLSKDIFESELFGHIRGAFTGADYDKTGRFETANTGTVYLDDIDDVPYDLQVKLLRVLEQREIEKVGSSKPVPINVRLIASTKKDLKKLVAEGKFRDDLYYRLKVFPINIPPLRERPEDVNFLIEHYLKKYAYINKVQIKPEALAILMKYPWPGNVRELKNLMERLVLLASKGVITTGILPLSIKEPGYSDVLGDLNGLKLEEAIRKVETSLINKALRNTNNKSNAAEALGLPLSTLRSKMEKYGIG